MPTNNVLFVDSDLRTISIPEGVTSLGVECDDKVNKIQFSIPRYYHDFDLSQFEPRINYVNANGEGDIYKAVDMTVNGERITFTWLVSRFATAKKGPVTFNVCLKKFELGAVAKEFNTKPATLQVLEGLETTEKLEQVYPDLFEEWRTQLFNRFSGKVDKTLSMEGYAADASITGEELSKLSAFMQNKAETSALAAERARIDLIVSGNTSPNDDSELIDIRSDFYGLNHASAGTAVRQSASLLNRVKQRTYGYFENLEGIIHNGSVYNVDSKTEQNQNGGYYGEFSVANESVILVSGFSWSSYSMFPLGAFYDSSGSLIRKIGHTWSGAHNAYQFYVPENAATLIVNGNNPNTPIVQILVAGDLEGDISELRKDISSKVRPSKLSSYEELGVISETIPLSADNTELLEAQVYNESGRLTSGVVGEVVYDTLYFPVGIYESFMTNKYTIGVHGGAFLDADKNWISSFKSNYPNNLEERVVPTNAYYIAISVNSLNRYWSIVGRCKKYSLTGLVIPTADNLWNNKKIVWIGTSVSFGEKAETSYPYEAANLLGFQLVNCSVPGLAVHTNSDGTPLTYGSLVLSKSEYAANGTTIPDSPISYIPGGNYNNYYRTYENVFSEDNADADLYVFDIAPNNSNFATADWDAFDFSNWAYKDGSSFSDHRTTFLGAILFLMDKMYELNENARMIFVLGSSFAYAEGKSAFKKLADKWNIPTIDLWGRMNTSPKSILKLNSEDGTNSHPSTFAHEIMGRMLSHDLNSIG